ncbi:MAG: prolipoprotein diacylglyceryl transferase [Campylobacterales bacterium]
MISSGNFWWPDLYSKFDPVALHLGPLPVHWYGLMYVLALLSAFWIAKKVIVIDRYPISEATLDEFATWEIIGVILGARLGYILFYDTHTLWYLAHPWEIFNPFVNGVFTGIRGFSYHGGFIGFIVASWLFSKRHRVKFWVLMDLAALSVPLAYTFGRIGNFLNQELYGRATDLPWAIWVAGAYRHPSQLYEAFLEGIVVFVILWLYRRRRQFEGELATLYGFLYGFMRFIAEFWREPDIQLGYLAAGLTMGQWLCIAVMGVAVFLWWRLYHTSHQAH